MADDPLRSVIDAIRSKLHDELESQLTLLSSRQQAELEGARRTAEADAEQRWAAKVDAVRAEWTARLESEVGASRAEAERRMVAEAMRLRVEAEQAAAESAARVREELEQALSHERERAATTLSSERQHFQRELEASRQELAAARQDLATSSQEIESLRRELADAASAREQAEDALEQERRAHRDQAERQEQDARVAAEARVAERQAQLEIVERLLAAIRSMDAARTLSDVLAALTTSAAAEAPRVALFVVNGTELRGWKASGFNGGIASLQVSVQDEGLFGDVMRRREPVATANGAGPQAPAFAALPSDRAAIAVPLLVGAQPVAVLYADDAAEGPAGAPASWPEAIQILGRHASVNLAHLTAARAADTMRRSLAPPAAPAAAASGKAPAAGMEDPNSARRYARLLVSEIKLYNEAAVRAGRQQRDLLSRLKPEIDRARKLYEQRISPAVDSRGALFQQELVQTLADGDPSLLGGST